VGDAPTTAGMKWLTWEQSAQQLLDAVLGGAWDAEWSPLPESGEPELPAQTAKGKIPEEVD
jgi:hypothetical protein